MPTSASRSTQRSRPVSLVRSASYRRSASTIWLPTVCTGLSALIGSWKIIAISRPRIDRNSSLFGSSCARSMTPAWSVAAVVAAPWKRMLPPTMRPGGGMMPRMERAATDLPQPLSPTMPTMRCSGTWNDSPSTARTTPRLVKNQVRSPETSRRGFPAVLAVRASVSLMQGCPDGSGCPPPPSRRRCRSRTSRGGTAPVRRRQWRCGSRRRSDRGPAARR